MTPRNYNVGGRFAAPALAHTMTESAEQARQAVRQAGKRKREAKLVTAHPKRHSGHIPPAAERFVQLALTHGFRVKVVEGWATVNHGKSNEAKREAVQVAGIDKAKRRGFRATWVNGKAGMGIWYEAGVTPRTGHPVGITSVAERIAGGAS